VRRTLGLAGLVAIVVLAGCGTRSSVIAYQPGAQRYEGPVAVTGTMALGVGVEVGIVEVDSVESLETALAAFRERVAQVGGDHGVVDRASTSFEMVTSTESYSYSCGTSSAPRTCNGTRTVTREVATMHLFGRALRTRGGP
jgi:hypothetical protein